MKSEKIRKLENELADLEQWLKLGLVPKKDIDKHKMEIDSIRQKISDEAEKLQMLKESGDAEEFELPKRSAPVRASYQETNTMAGDNTQTETTSSEGLDLETESFDADTSTKTRDTEATFADDDDDDDDPFSDKNRWRRGILEDPDLDQW